MTSLFLPKDAPFTTEQQTWLAGFFAGLALQAQQAGESAGGTPTLTCTILYGSQTGNCEMLADDLANLASTRGLGASVTAMDDFDVASLPEHQHLVVITSTYGEGEMPDNAELFWEALASDSTPRIEETSFAVLALGDRSYDDFCHAGKLIDTRLEQLGANRLVPRVDCDVDFEDDASAWLASAVEKFAALAPGGATAPASGAPARPARERSKWNRKNPFRSSLVTNRLLSGDSSAKEIRHYELDLGDSGISYAAGDALNIVPLNSPELVGLILDELGIDGSVEVQGQALSELLRTGKEIVSPSRELIDDLAAKNPDGELAQVVRRGQKDDVDDWLWGKDTLDLLQGSAEKSYTAEQFADLLRPLQHRSYSISSSPQASPDRIHLTVASVRYPGTTIDGTPRPHHGVCSTFLADIVGQNGDVDIFLQPNTSFRVPENPEAPVIMVGPGTGIAPFRAFLQERQGRGATGKNWLFFGDQHRESDFIYEDELQHFADQGVLTRLDLAFSRDQAEKIYVQTRMKEQGRLLYSWLTDGAYFYVCGDANRMAKDVDKALHEVVAEHGGVSEQAASEYISNLKRAKRYVRDVY